MRRILVATAIAGLIAGAATAPAAAAPKPAKATIKVTGATPRSLDAGGKVTVSGETSANLRGKKVYLQKRTSKKWTSLANAKVSSKGAVKVTAKLTKAGRNQALRLYAPKTAKRQAATASAGTFTVYGWYYLNDRKPEQGSVSTSTRSVNGTTYPRNVSLYSYSINGHRVARFGLARKCTTFQATIGIDDQQSSKSQLAGRVSADDAQVWAADSVVRGQAFPVDVDISSALDLNLEVSQVAQVSTYLVFGNARIRCAF